MLKQKTLKDSFSLSGKGLHTGLDLTVTFNPAPDNHGTKSNVSTWKDSLPRCRCRQRIRNYPWNCNLQKRSKVSTVSMVWQPSMHWVSITA